MLVTSSSNWRSGGLKPFLYLLRKDGFPTAIVRSAEIQQAAILLVEDVRFSTCHAVWFGELLCFWHELLVLSLFLARATRAEPFFLLRECSHAEVFEPLS